MRIRLPDMGHPGGAHQPSWGNPFSRLRLPWKFSKTNRLCSSLTGISSPNEVRVPGILFKTIVLVSGVLSTLERGRGGSFALG